MVNVKTQGIIRQKIYLYRINKNATSFNLQIKDSGRVSGWCPVRAAAHKAQGCASDNPNSVEFLLALKTQKKIPPRPTSQGYFLVHRNYVEA